jgi:outer membrane lipoprotein SlyB
MDLAKLLALSIGATIVISLVYDRVRKVGPGDRVVVVSSNFYPAIFGRHGRVTKVSRDGNEVKVKLDDGEEVVGIVESHETLFSPPVVRAMYSERKIE